MHHPTRCFLQDLSNAENAVEDFGEVIERDRKFVQAFERRSEVRYIPHFVLLCFIFGVF